MLTHRIVLIATALLLAGCQTYRASWPDGPTIEVHRVLTDAKVGAIRFNPQSGELTVENLDSTQQLAATIQSLSAALRAAPTP